MNGSRSKSGSDEEKINNDYNSFKKTNETPNYIKELMKSLEERNNNESKSNEDEIEENSYRIKKDASSPNLSGIYLKKSQKSKENEDKSQEEEKGKRSCESLFSSFNELKHFFEEEEDEFKDINHIDMKELGKIIKMFIKFYMIWKKENKDKKLNKKENIIQRNEDQINKYNSNIGKKFELENRISEQKFILDNLKESEEQKIKNDDLENKNIILRNKVYGQNNKNSHLDIKNEQLMISNKDLEDRKQRGENSKEINLILSPSQKELKNALKKKEEKEAKIRCKNKNISTKLKEKKNISIEKNKISDSISVIMEREKLQKSKIINKGNEKNIKYNNILTERNQLISNNQKSIELNNLKNDLKHKDDEIKQLRNKIQILENENNELKNKILTLSENAKEKLDMKNEIERIWNKLSILATSSQMNIQDLKLDELLNNQRTIMAKIQASNSQNQNDSDINGHNSIISNHLNSQIMLEEIQ